MKLPGPTLHDRIHETGSTDVLMHIGGWRVSVSPALVKSSLTTPVLVEVKTTHLMKNCCGFDA